MGIIPNFFRIVDLASVLEVRTDELLFDDSPAERSASMNEIAHVLEACNTQQIHIIEDLVKALKMTLDKHL